MKISCRISNKNAKQTGGQNNHDMRHGYVPAYINRTESNKNSIIITPESPAKLMEICIDRRNHRDPPPKLSFFKNAAISTSGIITFSRNAQPIISAMTYEKQDELFLKAANFIATELGTDLTGLIVHRDETAIHAHFQCPAVRFDGHPVSKKVDTRKLQDVAALPYLEYGITRGTPKKERMAAGECTYKWIHRSVKKMHDDLPQEIKVLEEKVRKNEDLIARNEEKLKDSNVELEKVMKRIEIYKKRAVDTRYELAELSKAVQIPPPQQILFVRKKKGVIGKVAEIVGVKLNEVVPGTGYSSEKIVHFMREQAARAAMVTANTEKMKELMLQNERLKALEEYNRLNTEMLQKIIKEAAENVKLEDVIKRLGGIEEKQAKDSYTKRFAIKHSKGDATITIGGKNMDEFYLVKNGSREGLYSKDVMLLVKELTGMSEEQAAAWLLKNIIIQQKQPENEKERRVNNAPGQEPGSGPVGNRSNPRF